MSNAHNHVPDTMYKGDKTQVVQWCDKKKPIKIQHMDGIVEGCCV